MRNTFKKEKGITLIALIITIIVLLILAGVALATITGNNGIIKNAENAVAQYQNQANKEQELLNTIDDYLNKYLGNKEDTDNPTVSYGKLELRIMGISGSGASYSDNLPITLVTSDNSEGITIEGTIRELMNNYPSWYLTEGTEYEFVLDPTQGYTMSYR